jgi:hypothetical protein
MSIPKTRMMEYWNNGMIGREIPLRGREDSSFFKGEGGFVGRV